MDMEKVIKGLECHRIDNNHRINCADCPYYVDDDNHINCVNDLHDDAITMLKEQEAVEPNPVHNSFRWFACGKCDCSITIEDRFCPRCGQAVKWE